MRTDKTKFPMRKITELIEHRSRAGFMSTMLVRLECGHEVVVSTATSYRARCYKCPPKQKEVRQPKKCDDCGDEINRGTRCKHCGKIACGWCYYHHHGASSVFYTPCDGQPKNDLNGYFDRVKGKP